MQSDLPGNRNSGEQIPWCVLALRTFQTKGLKTKECSALGGQKRALDSPKTGTESGYDPPVQNGT